MSTKGILGYRKDPKQQILFSFKSREGEEWPSDDSNPDYNPSTVSDEEDGAKKDPPASQKRKREDEEEVVDEPKVKKRKRWIKQRKKDKTKSDKTNAEVCHERGKEKLILHIKQIGKYAWGQMIPPEILLKIFQFVVKSQGSLPFLHRASKVCHLWSQTAVHPSLWSSVDLSYGWVNQKKTEAKLEWLCQNRFTQLQNLNLNGWKGSMDRIVQLTSTHCPNLQSLHLSHCNKLTSANVTQLAEKATNLKNIDLSFVKPDAVSPNALKSLIEKCDLTHLNVSGNKLRGIGAVMTHLMDHCPNLKLLDISNADFSAQYLPLPIEKLQTKCPKLEVLRLSNSKFRVADTPKLKQAQSPGFPELKELDLGVITAEAAGIDDSGLHRLLKTSFSLSLLDLRGSSSLTSDGVRSLPVTDLEDLYLARSSIANHEGVEMIVFKWAHSLKDLDISWNTNPNISQALHMLNNPDTKSKLEQLDVSGTSVCVKGVRSVLEGCKKLKTLRLSSCRGLPRGIKHDYNSKNQIRKLKKELNNHKNIETSSDSDD